MAVARLTEAFGRSSLRPLESEAQTLARVLPRLALEARQVSAQVALGIHGRRRAGPGETFWQFRHFTSGEPADRIDWRRSARDDRLYVREREWETASTYWLWIDLSASMGYMSAMAKAAKRDRALVLGLAMADLLVRGGERVGLLGLTPPLVSRNIINRFTEVLLQTPTAMASDMPNGPAPGPRDRVLLIGDLIVEHEDFANRLNALTSRGSGGTALQIRDPAEHLFPYAGETEFIGPEHGERWTVGDAQGVGEAYRQRLAAHEAALRSACLRRGWTFQTHTTDKTATEGLLSIAMLLQQGAAAALKGG